MDVKLICAADLHLGRRPSRFPEAWAEGRVASATGWENLVDRALAASVDAVLLAGDVIDRFNRSFEAHGPLTRGVRRLAEAGIPVVAVAGNHDFDTLPAVADEVGGDAMVLLGRGGAWERWTLRGDDGRPRLHVDGWSFASERHDGDPTTGWTPAPGDGAPVVGLLHCDLDQAGSPYAPVRSADLRGRAVDAWVLGHIHAPALHEAPGSAPLLYPGSLQALDPGETGVHGAWTLTVGAGREPVLDSVPLSAVHYATVDVDAGGAADRTDLAARVRTALAGHLDALAVEGEGRIRASRCRVRLTGRTPLHGRIEEALENLEELDLDGPGDLRLSVDPRPVVDTRPDRDLEELARGDDPAAHLAGLLLALDAEGPEADPDLLDAAARAAGRIAARSHYAGQRLESLDTEPDGAVVRAALRRQAGRLLDAVIAEREAR